MTYNQELERAGVPSYDLGACRLCDYESETLDFHHLDLTGASVECYISEHRDSPERLATLVVSKQTQTQSYQAFIDECRFEEAWIPCGDTPADMMTSSVINLSSAQTSLAALPRAAIKGDPVILYYTLRQTAPSQDIILAGRFHLTETA